MNRTTIIYGILGILILILVFLVWFFQRPKSTPPIRSQFSTITPPLPTTAVSQPISNTVSITPTLVPPQFTGGLDVTIPQPTVDASNQKQDLRRKTPYHSDAFDITFDYANDIFIVKLQNPKDTNKVSFATWLKQTYPLIPISNFIFQ